MEFNTEMERKAMIRETLHSNFPFPLIYNQKRKLKQACFAVTAVILSILLVAIGFGWLLVPSVIRQIILSKAVISPDANADLYSAWIHPPIPIYFKIYVFNVTNPVEVQSGFRPKLVEVGPYVFQENRTKINIQHDEDSDTITYHEHVTYHFVQKLSGELRLQDEVTIINVPFAAAAIKINKELPWPMDSLANMILIKYKESLFVRRTVEEIIFKGWTVPFLQKMEMDIGLTMIPNNTFGFLYGQNDTALGPYTVARGAKDKSLFGTILKYKNESELTHWPKFSKCNKLQGTDGTLFPPLVEKDRLLTLFSTDLCRSLYLSYNKSMEFEGIKGYHFTAPPNMLADPREGGEENRCFCPDIDVEPDKCLKRGTSELSPCQDGAPVAMSTVYFLDADPQYIEESGLVPNRSKHEIFIDVEPVTGMILQASKRVQINLMLRRVKQISSISKVPEMLFPLIWFDECASLDLENRLKLQSALYTVWLLGFTSKAIPLAIALVVFLLVVKRQIQQE